MFHEAFTSFFLPFTLGLFLFSLHRCFLFCLQSDNIDQQFRYSSSSICTDPWGEWSLSICFNDYCTLALFLVFSSTLKKEQRQILVHFLSERWVKSIFRVFFASFLTLVGEKTAGLKVDVVPLMHLFSVVNTAGYWSSRHSVNDVIDEVWTVMRS